MKTHMSHTIYQPASAASAIRVQQYLNELNLSSEVIELNVAAKTAQQAADALDVTLGQIAKSLIFETGDLNNPQPLLIIVSGDLRVDEARVEQFLNTSLRRANPKKVRDWTGYAIGGIPPLGHPTAIKTILDPHLRRFESVWAAGGTPSSVFKVKTSQLFNLLLSLGAQEADICHQQNN